jgi:FdhE protein
MTAPAWDRRIARADALAATHTAAAEPLKFYAEIARFQKAIYEELTWARMADFDTAVLLPHLKPLLSLVRRIGPQPLAQAARELAARDRHSTLPDQSSDEPHAFFARALLQPYKEYLARHSDIPVGAARSTCPFCGEKPQVGVLRGEGEGGKRSLICSLCSTEWEFRRILCPACGEETVDKLPVFTASEFEYVRVEACDSCRTYIKSVDLTRNGLAVPVVDELATISLNVWAEENGYRKWQLNLLGM